MTCSQTRVTRRTTKTDLVVLVQVLQVQRTMSVDHIHKHVVSEVKQLAQIHHAAAVNEDNSSDLNELRPPASQPHPGHKIPKVSPNLFTLGNKLLVGLGQVTEPQNRDELE